ncbi:MAG: rRNA maturation RNase YbeY [Chloroflexota bacterium]|nr:rRNA maturation RNase YbeY [Chloroflexota bacterium]
MIDHEININIKRGFGRAVNRKWLHAVIDATLSAQNIERPVEIGLVVTDDAKMRKLNREYRGIDDTTDVLSFALSEDAGDTAFVVPADGVSRLGEIIVSYPRAEAQAVEHNRPLDRELAWLIVHGVLHLLGYDHQDDAAEAAMREKEEAILKEIEA